jgi:hypothetical protein
VSKQREKRGRNNQRHGKHDVQLWNMPASFGVAKEGDISEEEGRRYTRCSAD